MYAMHVDIKNNSSMVNLVVRETSTVFTVYSVKIIILVKKVIKIKVELISRVRYVQDGRLY